jgi:3D (Asp-Asp-Asp) domain-containing protein
VDPKVISLGTWIEIKYPNGTIEKRRADDTGGVIKGNIVDIYVKKSRKEVLQLGRKQVKVRILSKGEY